jgi:hypothetical protein
MKKILLAIILMMPFIRSYSQTISDGLMMPKGTICTGFLFSHEQWKNYWEGTLKRENGNIGTFTGNSLMWVGNYGIANKVNVIAMIPYVWNKVSGGTLRPMEGLQDISIGAKYNFYTKQFGENKFNAFGAFTFSAPLSSYTPDFYPISIGTHTTNLSYRVTGNYALGSGFYVNATGAYTWRSNTMLDRPSYYDSNDGSLHLTNKVKMPNVIDFSFNIGYHKGPLQVDANFMKQNVLGGGDIRRQDMPFVSYKMNYAKAGLYALYYLPVPKGLAVRAGASYTLTGINVGQSFAVSFGLLYVINFAQSTN